MKLNPDGSMERYKARLVTKGYTQREGLDVLEIFSPVAKTVSVKVIITLASAQRLPLHQLDINNAFLHGDLEEEVYMDLPLDYHSKRGVHFFSYYGLQIGQVTLCFKVSFKAVECQAFCHYFSSWIHTITSRPLSFCPFQWFLFYCLADLCR